MRATPKRDEKRIESVLVPRVLVRFRVRFFPVFDAVSVLVLLRSALKANKFERTKNVLVWD